MQRRKFLTLLAGPALGWPIGALGQQRLPLVAVLFASSPGNTQGFRSGMADLGYVDGRNIRMEYRYAEGDLGRLSELAAELVGLKPSVIVSAPSPAHLAVVALTRSIPIVMATGADPVGFGLIASLSHPGGNVTGLSNFAEGLPEKQFEILKELIPDLRKPAILLNSGNRLSAQQRAVTVRAAERAGTGIFVSEVRNADELGSAFQTLATEKIEAVVVAPDPTFSAARAKLAELTAQHRIAACFGYRENVDAGGLMSYGVNNQDLYRRAATFVDKILKGAKPADLPVEQATKFEFIINLKTAKKLDFIVPATLLARADEVIE
jgi:putative tryptophan/tyrosine transport system substrate-binding protein